MITYRGEVDGEAHEGVDLLEQQAALREGAPEPVGHEPESGSASTSQALAIDDQDGGGEPGPPDHRSRERRHGVRPGRASMPAWARASARQRQYREAHECREQSAESGTISRPSLRWNQSGIKVRIKVDLSGAAGSFARAAW